MFPNTEALTEGLWESRPNRPMAGGEQSAGFGGQGAALRERAFTPCKRGNLASDSLIRKNRSMRPRTRNMAGLRPDYVPPLANSIGSICSA